MIKRKFIMITVIFSLVCLVGSFGLSGQAYSEEKNITVEETEGGVIKIGNTFCPLSRQKVGGSMGPAVEHEHKERIYNFCCQMCIVDFKKDSEKYIKVVDEMMEDEKAKESGEGHGGHEHH